MRRREEGNTNQFAENLPMIVQSVPNIDESRGLIKATESEHEDTELDIVDSKSESESKSFLNVF